MIRTPLALMVLLACNVSCSTAPDSKPAPPVFFAERNDTSVVVDGRLDEPVWQRAVAYPLVFCSAVSVDNAPPYEPGTVRLAWDDTYLYAAFKFTDSDVVEEGDADHLLQQRTGDLAELFLKPEKETWYWEFHVTPRGRKSAFFFPGGGHRSLPSCYDHRCGMVGAGVIDGTLNAWQDRDRGWTAEIAIPIEDLTARGELFGHGCEWRVLAGRYNYSRYLPEKELSAAPALPKVNFHDLANYAVLRLTDDGTLTEVDGCITEAGEVHRGEVPAAASYCADGML